MRTHFLQVSCFISLLLTALLFPKNLVEAKETCVITNTGQTVCGELQEKIIISSNSSFSYKLAVTKAVKSPMLVKQVRCENTTSLDLKSLPGYPLNNPKKYLYNFLPYRANSGNYSIILNDDRVCDIHYYGSDDNSLKEQQKALVKFAKRNFGVKPLGICEVTGHLNIIKCRRLK